jgi:hypothetical protein
LSQLSRDLQNTISSLRFGDKYASPPLEAFAIDAAISLMSNLVAGKAREKELHFPINLCKDFKVIVVSQKYLLA